MYLYGDQPTTWDYILGTFQAAQKAAKEDEKATRLENLKRFQMLTQLPDKSSQRAFLDLFPPQKPRGLFGSLLGLPREKDEEKMNRLLSIPSLSESAERVERRKQELRSSLARDMARRLREAQWNVVTSRIPDEIRVNDNESIFKKDLLNPETHKMLLRSYPENEELRRFIQDLQAVPSEDTIYTALMEGDQSMRAYASNPHLYQKVHPLSKEQVTAGYLKEHPDILEGVITGKYSKPLNMSMEQYYTFLKRKDPTTLTEGEKDYITAFESGELPKKKEDESVLTPSKLYVRILQKEQEGVPLTEVEKRFKSRYENSKLALPHEGGKSEWEKRLSVLKAILSAYISRARMESLDYITYILSGGDPKKYTRIDPTIKKGLDAVLKELTKLSPEDPSALLMELFPEEDVDEDLDAIIEGGEK